MIYPAATESMVAQTINQRLMSKIVSLGLVADEKIKAAREELGNDQNHKILTSYQ